MAMQTTSSSTSKFQSADNAPRTTPDRASSPRPSADHRPRATTRRRARPERRTDRFGVFAAVEAPAAAPAPPAPGHASLADERGMLHSFVGEPAKAAPIAVPRVDSAPEVELAGEYLGPPLPPVIDARPRSKWAVTALERPRRTADAARVIDDGRAGQSAPSAKPRNAARSRRARVRLTLRGRLAVVALIVGAVAGTSALASADRAATVPAAEVQVAAGDSVSSIAVQTAAGRDVAEVAAAIQAANGLEGPADAPLEPGLVVVVPGSAG